MTKKPKNEIETQNTELEPEEEEELVDPWDAMWGIGGTRNEEEEEEEEEEETEDETEESDDENESDTEDEEDSDPWFSW